MAMMKIGTKDLPAPSKYSVTLQDIDGESTRRTEAGTLIRDRVRAGVYKIQATWKVKDSDLKTITDAIAPAKFSVTFYDPTTDTTPQKEMQCGDRSAELKLHRDGESLWELTVTLTEY